MAVDSGVSGEQDRLEVLSFRVVFDLERRLHRIDRWRIPVPHGVPVRGIGYAVVALVAILFLQRVPVVREVVLLLPPPLRLVIVPIGFAYALARLGIDGRPAHASLLAFCRLALSPGMVSGFRAVPGSGSEMDLGELVLVPDERCARYRPAVINGPARVLFRLPARARARGRRLDAASAAGTPMMRGKELVLREGQRLRVR